jgi:hypothetical protein
LWPDEIRIALCRDRAILARIPGRGRHSAARHIQDCDSASRSDWRPALRAAADALGDLGWRKGRVTFVLSNEFVRYQPFPWHDRLSDESEKMAYARHLFEEVHGDAVDGWELRVSQEKYRAAGLASAVDRALIESLETSTHAAGLELVSVQPYLMAAFNQWRNALTGPSCCFVLAERGRLCLALIRGRDWIGVRNLPLEEDAGIAAMQERLERELFLSGWDSDECGVFVHAPEHPSLAEAIAESGKWRVRLLPAEITGAGSVPADAQYAMAFQSRRPAHCGSTTGVRAGPLARRSMPD